MFYYFHAKKNYLYKFFGGRPLDAAAVYWDEVPFWDIDSVRETFFSEYGDIMEYSTVYEEWFYTSDAFDRVVEHVQHTIILDNARKELQKFVDNEVTERWLWAGFGTYYDPKYKWYS